MREPNNKDYAYANYGWDNDSIDQFEMSPDSGYCQKEGTKESFMMWYTLATDSTRHESVVYEDIKNIVDIDEYIKGLEETAKVNGVSFNKYLKQWIGTGVSKGDVESAMEYYFIGGKHAEKLYDDYSAGVTAEEIQSIRNIFLAQ